MVPPYRASTADRGPDDFLHVRCACGHETLTPFALLLHGLQLRPDDAEGARRGELMARLTTLTTAVVVLSSLTFGLAGAAMDQAELILSRCGTPTRDASTAYEQPRPPVPSRVIEYADQKLRFLLAPAEGVNLDDPPPYSWQLIGVTDMESPDEKGRVVEPPEAKARMPCAFETPAQ